MRIGILTYHSVYNFGANLQTLSTVEYLKKKGIEPIVINWIPLALEDYYNKNTSPEQIKIHKEFINTYLPISKLCRTDDDIVDVIEKNGIDGIIVGSDAVVQHVPFLSRIRFPSRKILSIIKPTSDKLYPNPFWGSYLSKLKKIIPVVMMSVSCQNTDYRKIFGKERKQIFRSINMFKFISVRDTWTQNMIHYLTYSTQTPEITPDPVFAFNQNAQELLLSRHEILIKYNLPENYLLLSFKRFPIIKKDWVETLKKLANKKGYSVVGLPMPQGINDLGFDRNISLPLSPLDWFALIKYSSAYIGHNMHPIIVSIHNNIPFFSVDYYGILKYRTLVNKRSSKIYDLLTKSGFGDNMYNVLGFFKKGVSPQLVMERISEFKSTKCKEVSDTKYLEYTRMMKKIEDIFHQYYK
ncbi:MAG: polysaccharide pyruvyl transferase family protein [Bacteroidales bacterium]|nr:polysaccharide pyruvyl transferase family protein [Bacteroidales bacterium]